jgi:hypothetical protein
MTEEDFKPSAQLLNLEMVRRVSEYSLSLLLERRGRLKAVVVVVLFSDVQCAPPPTSFRTPDLCCPFFFFGWFVLVPVARVPSLCEPTRETASPAR